MLMHWIPVFYLKFALIVNHNLIHMTYYSGGNFRLHQTSIKETNRMLENIGLSKPDYYPCIVLRVDYNKYYPLKLIISEAPEEVDPEHKVYRQIIFGGVYCIDSYIEQLKDVLDQESIQNNCNACLCLNQQLCIYYDIQERMKFNVSTNVPVHTWIKDDEFLSFPVIVDGLYSKRFATKIYDFQC